MPNKHTRVAETARMCQHAATNLLPKHHLTFEWSRICEYMKVPYDIVCEYMKTNHTFDPSFSKIEHELSIPHTRAMEDVLRRVIRYSVRGLNNVDHGDQKTEKLDTSNFKYLASDAYGTTFSDTVTGGPGDSDEYWIRRFEHGDFKTADFHLSHKSFLPRISSDLGAYTLDSHMETFEFDEGAYLVNLGDVMAHVTNDKPPIASSGIGVAKDDEDINPLKLKLPHEYTLQLHAVKEMARTGLSAPYALGFRRHNTWDWYGPDLYTVAHARALALDRCEYRRIPLASCTNFSQRIPADIVRFESLLSFIMKPENESKNAILAQMYMKMVEDFRMVGLEHFDLSLNNVLCCQTRTGSLSLKIVNWSAVQPFDPRFESVVSASVMQMMFYRGPPVNTRDIAQYRVASGARVERANAERLAQRRSSEYLYLAWESFYRAWDLIDVPLSVFIARNTWLIDNWTSDDIIMSLKTQLAQIEAREYTDESKDRIHNILTLLIVFNEKHMILYPDRQPLTDRHIWIHHWGKNMPQFPLHADVEAYIANTTMPSGCLWKPKQISDEETPPYVIIQTVSNPDIGKERMFDELPYVVVDDTPLRRKLASLRPFGHNAFYWYMSLPSFLATMFPRAVTPN